MKNEESCVDELLPVSFLVLHSSFFIYKMMARKRTVRPFSAFMPWGNLELK